MEILAVQSRDLRELQQGWFFVGPTLYGCPGLAGEDFLPRWRNTENHFLSEEICHEENHGEGGDPFRS